MTHTVNLDDFLKNHILTNLKIHPDGKFGLYFDNTLDFDDDKYNCEVFLINLETFESEALKLDVIPDDYYFHGEFVLMKLVEKDKTTFYSYHVSEGKQSKVCEIPFAIQSVDVVRNCISQQQ